MQQLRSITFADAAVINTILRSPLLLLLIKELVIWTNERRFKLRSLLRKGVYVLCDECILCEAAFILCVYVCVCVSAEPESAGDGSWHPEDLAAAHLCSSVWYLRLSEHRLWAHLPHRSCRSAAHAAAGVSPENIQHSNYQSHVMQHESLC